MLHLTTALDPASGVPLYEQLYRSLAGEIRSGALPAGPRMKTRGCSDCLLARRAMQIRPRPAIAAAAGSERTQKGGDVFKSQFFVCSRPAGRWEHQGKI